MRRKRRVRRALAGAAIFLLALVIATAAWVFVTLHSAGRTMNLQPGIDDNLSQVLERRERSKPFTVLLLGSDQRPWDKGARADTIIVARVDVQAKKVWLLSIPRDTRVQIPGKGTGKINAANFYGGPSLMVETVRDFLGIPVNHYMSVDLTGFQKVVDAVGGVWVNVEVDINDRQAATHSPGGRARKISKGYQLLDGEHALTYVRSRAFPDGDFTRIKHQQEFFRALVDQMTKTGNLLKIPSIVSSMAEYMSTDMSLGDMVAFANALSDIRSDNIETATLAGEWRSPYVWTDMDRKELLVTAMMEGRSFEDTSTPSVSTINPADVSITVRNGAGIDGCAAATAQILRTAGYKVDEVGNANQFVYAETLVVYKTGEEVAKQVAAELPKARTVPSRGMYLFDTDILVVVGKDFATWPTFTVPSRSESTVLSR